MKSKLYIFFVFLVFNFSLSGQNYFPKGAIWHYNVPSFFSSSFHYTTIESKGDSIFNNDTLIFLEGWVECSDGYNELIKTNNGKVYRLNLCDSSYSLLYDFTANVGDTIFNFVEYCVPQSSDTMAYIIDSIRTININGFLKNEFFISYITPLGNYYIGYSIIEGIGGNESFYPIIGWCDPVGGPLRCYNDSILGEYKNQYYYGFPYTGSCDTIYVGIEENIAKLNISIFPNPTSDIIYIETEDKINNIEIYSLSGKKLLATKNKEINLSTFSKGFYLLKISFEKEVIYRKVFKQ